MPNNAGLIRESIWRNKEFRQLPRVAQCTYVQLCSQKDLDCAGMLTLNIGMLAKGCDGIDEPALRDDLKVLEDQRFIFVDEDTDELFIRAYMRTAEVTKSPNIFKSALKSVRMVESPKLRHEVAAELRRLRRAEADRAAEELDPSPTPRDNTTNPSETLPKNGTLPEPSSTGTVTGTGSSFVGGHLGGQPPRPECRKHTENSDTGCHACRRRREWDKAHADQIAAAAAEQQRAARAARAAGIAACTNCDDEGWALGDDGTTADPAAHCPLHS